MTYSGSLTTPLDEPIEFEYEGFFTHWVCPKCGHNDWDEGDTRGEEIECSMCGTKGRIANG